MTLFVQSAQAAGLIPSVIIDEANLVFSPEVSDTMEAGVIADRNRAVLNLLTSMTKEVNMLRKFLQQRKRHRQSPWHKERRVVLFFLFESDDLV